MFGNLVLGFNFMHWPWFLRAMGIGWWIGMVLESGSVLFFLSLGPWQATTLALFCLNQAAGCEYAPCNIPLTWFLWESCQNCDHESKSSRLNHCRHVAYTYTNPNYIIDVCVRVHRLFNLSWTKKTISLSVSPYLMLCFFSELIRPYRSD